MGERKVLSEVKVMQQDRHSLPTIFTVKLDFDKNETNNSLLLQLQEIVGQNLKK